MREFKSLKPKELPRTFNAEIHGEEPIVTVEETEGCITIQYTFPGFYLSDDERDVKEEKVPFKQVNIQHTGFLGESGKPLLPSFGRYVQIPFNCDYKITVEKGESVQFDDVIVLPAQEQLTDSPEEHVFEYDREFYSKDQFYPENVVNVSGPFEIDGYNSLLLHVRPLQYNPSRKKLVGFSAISVTIDVTPKKYEYTFMDPDLDRRAYGNLFLNPKRRIEERVIPDRDAVNLTSTKSRGPEFLIIYHDTFREAAEKLEKWKTMRGLPTEIVSTEEVGRTKEAIQSYIRRKRKPHSSQLRYVLLFGDTDVIPPFSIRGSPFGDINVTDYYYSTKMGPPSDLREYVFPWLSIGRIPVKTAEEGLTVVDQIIAYEKNPPEDPDYYKRMVFAAYFEDEGRNGRADRAFMKTMEYVRERMEALGFDVERVYVTSNKDMQEYHDGTKVPEEVKRAVVDEDTAVQKLVSAMSKGCLIIGHRDHGGKYGWQHPPFRKEQLDAVTGDTPTVFYSINCLTGRFDLSRRRDSFAEKLLKMKGGAPSVIAATRESNTWLNDDLMKALLDAVWAGVLQTFGSTASYPVKYSRLGDILNYAKAYLPIAMSDGPRYIKDHFEIYHVIGDPTLELLRVEPAKMDMQVKEKGGNLDIRISACPKGSIITVWHKDKLLKKIEPYSHSVPVPLRGTAPPEEVSVCFWAPGYRFQQAGVAE